MGKKRFKVSSGTVLISPRYCSSLLRKNSKKKNEQYDLIKNVDFFILLINFFMWIHFHVPVSFYFLTSISCIPFLSCIWLFSFFYNTHPGVTLHGWQDVETQLCTPHFAVDRCSFYRTQSAASVRRDLNSRKHSARQGDSFWLSRNPMVRERAKAEWSCCHAQEIPVLCWIPSVCQYPLVSFLHTIHLIWPCVVDRTTKSSSAHHSSLSHCGLILAQRVELVCVS